MKGIPKAPALCLLAALLILGCGTVVKYTHPTKDSYEYENDKAECIEAARRYAAQSGTKDNILLISTQTEQCVEKRGWVKTTQRTLFSK